MEHYRCFKCYIPKFNSERTALTVEWFPHDTPIPQPTLVDHIKQLVTDLNILLEDKKRSQFISLQYGSETLNAFQQIADILKTPSTMNT